MNPFIILKYIHILSAIIMTGASIVNGAIEMRAMLRKDINTLAFSMETVEFLNRYLVFPGLVMLPLSGILLALVARYSFTAPWILYSLILMVLLFVAFFTGGRVENELGGLAKNGLLSGKEGADLSASERYKQVTRRISTIGGIASLMILIVLYMMITKRLPFGF